MTTQKLYADLVGLVAKFTNGSSSLNGAAKYMALSSFVLEKALTLNEVRFNVASVVGTLAVNSISIEIWSDNGSGSPSASLGAVTGKPVAGWNTYSGYSIALSANTQYHIVARNLNTGTETTNYIAIPYFNNGAPSSLGRRTQISATTGAFAFYGFFTSLSTDSGSTWTGQSLAGGVFRLGFSDGTYLGSPISNYLTGAASGLTTVYAKRAIGSRFTVPANWNGNIAGAIVPWSKAGSPSNLNVNFYLNDVLKGTVTLPVAYITTAPVHMSAVLATPFAAVGGDVISVVLRSSADTDTSGNNYAPGEILVDSDANSLPLLGEWSQRGIFTLDDSGGQLPSAYTLVSGSLLSSALMIQSSTPYNAASSAGRLVGGTLVS